MSSQDEGGLVYLRVLAQRYPTVDAALARIAHLEAELTLPKGTVHVISDVHGEFKKLKHVINNASGSLRPLVEQTFGDSLSAVAKLELLNLIYYPREAWAHVGVRVADAAERRRFVQRSLRLEVAILRGLVRRYSFLVAEEVFPPPYQALLRELLLESEFSRGEGFVDALLEPFLRRGKELELLRVMAHVIRNLSVAELIVAGDLGDRGPRIDKVIDYIARQPNVAMTWGNHDASWMGACLGQEAAIATVMRLSMRYGRLAQLEEGYGIPAGPLEKLAWAAYGDDPAACFAFKGESSRAPLLMARMQKAAAILQFKLEGQTTRRNPDYQLEHRNLLHRLSPNAAGETTVEIDGKQHLMLDGRLPTVNPADPYALSADEQSCIDRLRESFLESAPLWQQMRYVARVGSMYLRRDDNLIFHGCVPVDAEGVFLPVRVDGVEYRGRALFEVLNLAVQRAFRSRDTRDVDRLWYLWTGPLSPLFGKDRMATFETYFVADKETHRETKNPYFKLIHTVDFCRRVMTEFGVDPARGLIVNGHVPVKVEKGESPLKEGGLAVTIDGAFSEAYGDQGYTLVLDASRTYLARHHHFESVAEAITRGADIIPTVVDIRVYDCPRTVGDTERGDELRCEIAVLEQLIQAYETNLLHEGAA